jgi:hypothetical protein
MRDSLGGLVGAILALVGIFIGHTIANLTTSEHPATHQEASGEGH